MRIIEKLEVEECGCYVERKTEDFSGEVYTDERFILCSEHW